MQWQVVQFDLALRMVKVGRKIWPHRTWYVTNGDHGWIVVAGEEL